LLRLLLGQGDREVAPEGLALPLVAGGSTQLDVDHEGLGLAGLENAEVPAARGQVGHRNERRLTADRADADAELRVVEVLTRGRVREAAAEVGGSGDAAGVGDGERLRDELTRLQVVEVEVDDTGVVCVVDTEHHRGGVDVDARGVGVVEDSSGAGDDAESEDGSGTDADDAEHVAVALGAVRRVERGVRGHYVPFLQLSCVGCI